MNKYKLLTGMKDFLPPESVLWQNMEKILFAWIESYGYGQIRTPILEATQLFTRSVGEETDIIGKEMYTFTDQSTESISLRPEGTASCLRAVIEANYLYSGPKKLWYYGPMFRRERPQKGRYRQFNQFGVEALGFLGPDIDVEIIAMCFDLWQRLCIDDSVELQLNTLGNKAERTIYKTALVAYLKQYEAVLDEDSKRRLVTNPLRILDSKNPLVQEICNQAPQLTDYLSAESLLFYEQLKQMLIELQIPFVENSRLVRGLDYYNHTVFEWVTKQLGSQGAICAGGRYNGLIQQLGGTDAAGIGFAMGIERIILLLETLGKLNNATEMDFYLVTQNQDCLLTGMKYAKILRDYGLSVYTHLGVQKMTTQFKKANASAAKYAMIVGDLERTESSVTFKDLRSSREQQTVSVDNMINFLNQWMN